MSRSGNDTTAVTAGNLVWRVYPADLPGLLGKRLEVRPGQQAVVVRGEEVSVWPVNRYRLGGLFGGYPRDVAIVDTHPVTLHPVLGGLLSGDNQLLEADFLVRVRVIDPRQVYQILGAGRDRLSVGELEGQVAAEVRRFLAAAARRYQADDLCTTTTVSQRISADLRSFLTTYLGSLGLEVEQVTHLSFLPAEDALRRAEAMRRLRERLRDTTLRERLKAVRDEKEFWDAIEQLSHEFEIRTLFRQEELEEIRASVLAEPAAEEAQGEDEGLDLAQALEQKVTTQQEQVMSRFNHLLKRLGYIRDETCEPSPIARLERWVTVLRALGTIIFFGTTLIALLQPDLFQNPRMPEMLTAAIGLVLGILAFVSAFLINRRAKARRAEERVAKAVARLSPERRRAAEQLVRAQVEAALEGVESNLQEAWTRAYHSVRQDLASPLRRLARSAGDLREEVQAAAHPASPLLTRPQIAPEALQPLLELDEGLLQQAEELVETSQSLHRLVVAQEWDDAENGTHSLEVGLQLLRSQFVQRNALLKGA